jgi:hypothetical protein
MNIVSIACYHRETRFETLCEISIREICDEISG